MSTLVLLLRLMARSREDATVRLPIMEKKSPEYVLRQLRYITSLAMNAAEAETLEQVLQQIADAARELIGARYAALGVPNQKGGLRFFKVSGITQAEIARIHHRPVGVGLLGVIMETRKPMRLNDMNSDSRAAGFPEGHPHMNSLLGMPIQIGDQLFGTLYLTDKESGDAAFTEEDEWLLEMMASSAALAIAGAQIRESQQNIARLQERDRIAMELHDSVIQSLYALGLGLDFASRADSIPPEMVKETLRGLNQIIEDIRAYILKLNVTDHGHAHTPLRQHIERAVADLYMPPDLSVKIKAPDTPSGLDHEVLEGVKSIIHECLSNVIRHAEASCVLIEVKEDKSHFHLTVTDDGKGFPASNLKKQQGLGLNNMRKRARLYGGVVSVESEPGKGTKIKLNIPLLRL
jgi:signal transduction histidine kinase